MLGYARGTAGRPSSLGFGGFGSNRVKPGGSFVSPIQQIEQQIGVARNTMDNALTYREKRGAMDTLASLNTSRVQLGMQPPGLIPAAPLDPTLALMRPSPRNMYL
jgi:hypothetical protein